MTTAVLVAEEAPAYRLEEQVGFLLRQVQQRHALIFAEAFGDDLTPMQWAALAKLADVGECSQNLLGRMVGIDPATMFGVAGRLVKRGLVHATPNPADARLVLLDLTPEGRGLAEAMKARGAEVTARTLAPLTPEEAAVLARLMGKLG